MGLDRRRALSLLSLAMALMTGAASASETAGARTLAPQGPGRIVQVLDDIEASLVESRYSPVTQVNPKTGLYQFDCSGMASWVLRRAAPAAWQKVRERSATGRLVARDFFRTIAAVQAAKPSWSWQRVERVEDAAPGDVIAWLKPPWRSGVTGHVGFVVAAPTPSQRVPGGFLVRFADASRYLHQDDSREGAGRDGFGRGTILLMAHPETGVPVGYGWYGDLSSRFAETEVVIGRPRR
jgi:hypothetical protein